MGAYDENGQRRQTAVEKLFAVAGRTALVTGAASGIGRRMATLLVEAGASVYFSDIDREAAESAALDASTEGQGEARAVHLDVSQVESVRTAFAEIRSRSQSQLDILICAAGISKAQWIEDMSASSWQRVLDVNLTGTFLCCQEAVRLMLPRKSGRIINIASIAATWAPRPQRFNGGYNYSASKAGVLGLTLRLAVELAPHGITANCVSPGMMLTPLTTHALSDEQTRAEALAAIPMGRLGTPSDLDGITLFLCSSSSAYLTGQNIVVDGGYSLW
jgi:NAD(P)-dependent dehydrogenase (short-subunit alcohol dehydrogenase family)